MAKKYIVKVKDKKEVAEGTLALYLEKPADFIFQAGQYLEITLLNPVYSDEEGNNRALSIASAPDEPFILVATRLGNSAFKKSLKELKKESEVQIEGPYGSFTLHQDSSYAAVFLIGGIGITPVRAIVLDAWKRKLPHKIFLFYSNRRPEDAAFLDELRKLTKEDENFKLIATMTEMEKSHQKWDGYQGYLEEKIIRENVDEVEKAVYYLAGPEKMVKAMRQILEQMKIHELQIKTEEFPGY